MQKCGFPQKPQSQDPGPSQTAPTCYESAPHRWGSRWAPPIFPVSGRPNINRWGCSCGFLINKHGSDLPPRVGIYPPNWIGVSEHGHLSDFLVKMMIGGARGIIMLIWKNRRTCISKRHHRSVHSVRFDSTPYFRSKVPKHVRNILQ